MFIYMSIILMLHSKGAFVPPLLFLSEALLKYYLLRCHPKMALWDKLRQEEAFTAKKSCHLIFAYVIHSTPSLSQSSFLCSC